MNNDIMMRLADKSREYREKEGRVSIIMVVVNFEGSNDETYLLITWGIFVGRRLMFQRRLFVCIYT